MAGRKGNVLERMFKKKEEESPSLTEEDKGLLQRFVALKSARLTFYTIGILLISFGVWVLAWGVMNLKATCPASPLFATSLVVLGSVLIVGGGASFSIPTMLGPGSIVFYVALVAYGGILIWATVQAFDDALWPKTRNGKGNELCALSFYNPAAISVICGWLLTPIITLIVSVFAYLIYGETLSSAMRHEAEKKGLIAGDDGSGNTGSGNNAAADAPAP